MDITPSKLKDARWHEQAKRELGETLKRSIDDQLQDITQRYACLPDLHVYEGVHMPLLQEARELYFLGYFYSCVITCAVTAERIARVMFRQRLRVVSLGSPRTDR